MSAQSGNIDKHPVAECQQGRAGIKPYDQFSGHSGAFVVNASACNSPLAPSILPFRLA